MSAAPNAPMSAAQVMQEMTVAANIIRDACPCADPVSCDDCDISRPLRDARTAVAAMAEREAALAKTIEAQTKRIAELEEDFRRIEWLALNPRGASMIIDGKARPCVFFGVSSAPENTLRQAIDAARAEARNG